eukprot:GEMP01015130.1.p1 GENE.GEMP01015130.1~~GEMP01015130.1.p1  ORF type:complete len:567 (+),score=91.91 GEMP01015130.1:190-1890(+)
MKIKGLMKMPHWPTLCWMIVFSWLGTFFSPFTIFLQASVVVFVSMRERLKVVRAAKTFIRHCVSAELICSFTKNKRQIRRRVRHDWLETVIVGFWSHSISPFLATLLPKILAPVLKEFVAGKIPMVDGCSCSTFDLGHNPPRIKSLYEVRASDADHTILEIELVWYCSGQIVLEIQRDEQELNNIDEYFNDFSTLKKADGTPDYPTVCLLDSIAVQKNVRFKSMEIQRKAIQVAFELEGLTVEEAFPTKPFLIVDGFRYQAFFIDKQVMRFVLSDVVTGSNAFFLEMQIKDVDGGFTAKMVPFPFEVRRTITSHPIYIDKVFLHANCRVTLTGFVATPPFFSMLGISLTKAPTVDFALHGEMSYATVADTATHGLLKVLEKTLRTVLNSVVFPKLVYPDGDIRIPIIWSKNEKAADYAPREVLDLWNRLEQPQGSLRIRLYAVRNLHSSSWFSGTLHGIHVVFCLEGAKDEVSSSYQKQSAVMVWNPCEEFTLTVKHFALQRLKCVVTATSGSGQSSGHIGVATIGLGSLLESPDCLVRHDWTIEQKRVQVGFLDLEVLALVDNGA